MTEAVPERDASAQADALARGECSAVALTEAHLARIERIDPGLNAFIRVLADQALAGAARSDERRRDGRALSPIDGLCIGLKDNIDVTGVQTTDGLAGGPVATADAFVVERLRAAGAVVIGKLNMHEGALGGTTDNPHHGRTHNPWRTGYTPGGSSGGSGAAVAACLCAAALGTDTMGSVRLPAHYCGVVGLKATAGVVSTRGVTPLSYRLDHVGPLVRSVRDLALLLPVLAAFDPESPGAAHLAGPAQAPPATDLRGVRIGEVAGFARLPLEPDVRAGFERGLDALRSLGAHVVRVDAPGYDTTRSRLAGLLVSEAEGAHALGQRLSARPQDFSPTFTRMLAYGRDAPSQRLVEAYRRVAAAGHGFRRLFETVDLVATPTAPQAAFSFDDVPPANQADLTAPGNFSGCPALTLPVGLTPRGLPTGLQLYAAPSRDGELIAVARILESALEPLPPPGP